MNRPLIALLIIVASIAVFSVPVVRRSTKRKKIYGGALAQAFHLIAIAAYIGVVPAFLCGSILAGPHMFGFPIGFTLVIIAFGSLMAYAIVERPARVNLIEEDHGWTEEDARTSGL